MLNTFRFVEPTNYKLQVKLSFQRETSDFPPSRNV